MWGGALLAALAGGGPLGCGGDAPPPPPPEEAKPAAPEPTAPAFEPDPALAAALAAVPADERSRTNPRSGEQALAEGEALYRADCAGCHGINGDGDGPAAAALPQRPSDFTDPARWAATTPGEKAWLTRKGVPGTAMTPRDLDAEQIWAVTLFIESRFQDR
jgi:mono/diheme cytochrome c family protein